LVGDELLSDNTFFIGKSTIELALERSPTMPKLGFDTRISLIGNYSDSFMLFVRTQARGER